MATITLKFEDSPAMRKVLRQLAGHCVDDNVPWCEAEIEEAEVDGNVPNPELAVLMSAYEKFDEVVNLTLDGEVIRS